MEKAVSWKKILIFAIAVCLFAGIIVKCNQFQKTPLASYKGQKYEKAVVTKIIKDNLAEDGSRYGTQKVPANHIYKDADHIVAKKEK